MWWLRKPKIIQAPAYESAFEQQISEADQTLDIKHLGAVVNINIIKKEDTLMVEKLKAYRVELEAKKTDLYATNYIPEIEEDVKAYRESLIKASEEHRAKAIAKVDSDIECIDTLIAREEAICEAEPTITN